MRLWQKNKYCGTLECISGIHIGDSKESTDIGGVDSPVVRRKDNGQPYIPGSSIKGKIRCLLEQVYGQNGDNKFKNNGHVIQELFGALAGSAGEICSSKLIVRDAFWEDKSAEMYFNLKTTDMPYTEVKFENVIDRIKGTTINGGIRQIERVPAGAIFNVEFVINIFADSEESAVEKSNEFDALLRMGINLLNHDYLGGSGSRGYGYVNIKIDEVLPITFLQD